MEDLWILGAVGGLSYFLIWGLNFNSDLANSSSYDRFADKLDYLRSKWSYKRISLEGFSFVEMTRAALVDRILG